MIVPNNESEKTESNLYSSLSPENLKLRVNTHVYIGDDQINFKELRLEQVYGEHHYFEFSVPFDILKKQFFDHPSNKINLIGKIVTIEFIRGVDTSDAYSFKGIVTEIKMIGKNGASGCYVVKGAGMTILLERGKRMGVYTEYDLSRIFDVLKEVNSLYSGKLIVSNKPTYQGQIDFLFQYNESDWEFIQRVCHQYGVNLFYTGKVLVIGDYEPQEAIKLMYDNEIIDISFSAKSIPNVFSDFLYTPNDNSTSKTEPKDQLEQGGTYADMVHNKSKDFSVNKLMPFNPTELRDINAIDLREMANKKLIRNAGETVFVEGIAKVHTPIVGQLLSISMPNGFSVSKLGTYRVVKSVHIVDQDNRYTNEFEAIPYEIKIVPVKERSIPIVNSIEAEVLNTDDPLNMGRVSVVFPFYTFGRDVWLRVLTVDAGSTSSKDKNRGLVFIPEAGSKVMVNFERNNPAFPYVAGALFNGVTGQGGGMNNGIKSITTRSGISIVFNDNTKGLHIQDGNECTWNMDGAGRISVKAPKGFSLETTDIEINATNNISFNIGGNMLTNIGKAHNLFANTAKSIISNDYSLFSKTALLSQKEQMQIQSDEFSAMGMQKLTLHSDKMLTTNSLGRMQIKSSKAVTMTQQADEAEVVNHDEIAIAVVQFRIRIKDKGYFGFDHFVVPNEDMEKAFISNIVSGIEKEEVKNGKKTPIEYATRRDTLMALRNQYNIMPVIRKTEATGNQEKEYFVPRMTLFPPTVDKSDSVCSDTEPITSVTLDIYLEIMEEIKKLELDYNKELFDISDISIAQKTPCEKQKIEDAITITCKKEFLRKEEIKVWAYPKTTSVADEESPKYLAGKLIVYPNDKTRRPKRKVVFVKVDTNWKNAAIAPEDEEGITSKFSDECLQIAFNQSLIESAILTNPDAASIPQADRDRGEDSFYLNLTRNPDFMIRKIEVKGVAADVYGKFIYNINDPKLKVNGNNYYDKEGLFIMKHYPKAGSTDLNLQPNKELYIYLRAMFDKKYPKYAGTMAVFCFGERLPTNAGLGGLALGLSCNSALIFGDQGENTIAHEVFHLLGLHHSFKNGHAVPLEKEQKFVFVRSATDNLMDYGKTLTFGSFEKTLPSGNGLWHWQWEIVNPRLKV